MGIRRVSAEEFKTAFDNAREWLLNRMFVGYHSDFSNCECYLTPADLGGFVITPQRELVNVFNKRSSTINVLSNFISLIFPVLNLFLALQLHFDFLVVSLY